MITCDKHPDKQNIPDSRGDSIGQYINRSAIYRWACLESQNTFLCLMNCGHWHVPGWFLLSSLGLSPTIAPSATLQSYTKDGSFLAAVTAFGCTELESKSSKLHLFNSWSWLPAVSFPSATGLFPRGSCPQPFHPFPLLKIFQDSSKRGEATALNTFQGGNRREFTSLIFLASWKPDCSRQSTARCRVMSVGAAFFQITHLLDIHFLQLPPPHHRDLI